MGQILSAGNGIDKHANGCHRIAAAASLARVANLAVWAGHRLVVSNRLVNRFNGHFNSRIPRSQQSHQDCAADRGVGILRFGRITPAPEGIFLSAGDSHPDSEFQRRPNQSATTRGIAGSPQRAVVHRSIRFCQCQHGKAVVVHAWIIAGPHKSSGGVLLTDDIPKCLADRLAVGTIVWILARRQQHHRGHTRNAWSLLSPLPHARVLLRADEIPEAGVVYLTHIAWHRIAVSHHRCLRRGRGRPECLAQARAEGRHCNDKL